MIRILRKNTRIWLVLLVLFCSIGSVTAQEDEEIQFGQIAVSSEPPGASIYLDDVLLEKKTNGFILDVYPGIHTIRLTLPGYRDFEKIISVDSGEITFVFHEFEQKLGTVAVSSEPEGAEIYLNSLYYGKTNRVIPDLPEGEYAIRLHLEGYPDRNGTVRIEEGTTTSYFYDFGLIPTTGSIAVTSDPRGAAIYLDGAYQGVTNRILRDVLPGKHDLVLQKAGYSNASTRIGVTAGETVSVHLTLDENDGRLTVTASPVEADVYIDGGFAGRTPFTGTASAGDHRVDIRAHGFADYSTVIRLTFAGSALHADLTPLAPSAIADAEQKIRENRQYDQTRAITELNRAKDLLEREEYAAAYDAAVKAAALAEDIDGDGVPNIIDLQPTVRNNWLYILSAVMLAGMALLIAFDWARLNARPEISIQRDPESDTDHMVVQLAVGMNRPYRAMICTVSHNGAVREYITSPGAHTIDLGEIASGVHTVSVECTVEKVRYGLIRTTAALEFEIASSPPEPQAAKEGPREPPDADHRDETPESR